MHQPPGPASAPTVAVLFEGPPPGEESCWLRLREEGAEVRSPPPSPLSEWSIELRHDRWGRALLAAPVPSVQSELLPPPQQARFSPWLLREEAAGVARATSLVTLTAAAGDPALPSLLRDRKRLLRFAHAVVELGGVAVLDLDARRIWSPAELEQELSHDANLDIEGLVGWHAVHEAVSDRLVWLHSHGLAELGAFDIDIIDPSPQLLAPGVEALRTLVSSILEGHLSPTTSRFQLAAPDGFVRLVPAAQFDRQAPPDRRGGRATPADVAHHVEARAVVCEPTGLLGRWLGGCEPSRLLSGPLPEGRLWLSSSAATALDAERARVTYPLLRRLHEELAASVGTPLVKLGYEDTQGTREHLWFAVERFFDDRVLATLTNQPWGVPHLSKGDRGEHDVTRLSDWLLPSPYGAITPRSQFAARRVRMRARQDRPG